MPKARIIIADSKDRSRRILKDLLIRSAYQVQADVHSAPDLLRKTRTFLPDLVIIDSKLEGGSVLEIAGILENDNLSRVLILAEDHRSSSLEHYARVIKPYTEETLISVVEVCLLYNNRFLSMQKEMDTLKENLANRKTLEKAKGIIMRNLGVDEEQAYRLMQKQSMDRSILMKDLARAVIAAEDIRKMSEER